MRCMHQKLSTHRFGWLLFGARLLFWLAAALTAVALALQLTGWPTEYKVAGPFAVVTNSSGAALVIEFRPNQRWWIQPTVGDDAESPFRSFVRLRIGDREVGPPHSIHQDIRSGKGFSHWQGQLVFSLPPGVANGPETIATLLYNERPSVAGTILLLILSTVLGYAVYSEQLWRYCERATAVALFTYHLILFGLCCVGTAASAVYIVSSLFALATGWALPTTALIRWSSLAEWTATNEPYFAYLLLMLSGLGAVTTWLIGSNSKYRPRIDLNEGFLRRLLAWCEFPIVACSFVLCISAMWVGIVRPGNPNVSSIGGMIPFLDAGEYLAASFDQVKDGFWNEHALRRPFAAAFRSVLLIFAGYSMPWMLIVQACLLAGATCFATYAVMTCRGIWAGLAFFALTYTYSRYFVPTTLTEPLGLFWALLSIPFLIKAFYDPSPRSALVAFAITAIALMTRMGSMFTLPALLVWLIWQFGKDRATKLRTGAAAICILLAILGMNSLLQHSYGKGHAVSTGNFSYVVCGLSMGTDWTGCLNKLASEGTALESQEDQRAIQLYTMAWGNFRAQPGLSFQRLATAGQAFGAGFPDILQRGYGRALGPEWLRMNALVAISLIGLLYGAMRRAESVEVTFWALSWVAIIASASMIYLDDGGRALAVSQPIIALFFAIGLSSRRSVPRESVLGLQASRNAFIGLAMAAALLLCVPWMAHRFSGIRSIVEATPSQQPAQAYVFGGRRISGFLVIGNDQPLYVDTPSLHLADFEAIIAQSGVEGYQELIHPILPRVPFGFIFAPRIERESSSSFQYIVPAKVLERRDVTAWRFYLERWGAKNRICGDCWFYVTSAEPWWPLSNVSTK